MTKETNLKFYKLIDEFKKISSIPVLLNTSFNIKGQPMVNTPSQAVDTFLRTKIDILAIGDYIITKKIILIITHDKKTFKKTRKVYLEQHKTFLKIMNYSIDFIVMRLNQKLLFKKFLKMQMF